MAGKFKLTLDYFVYYENNYENNFFGENIHSRYSIFFNFIPIKQFFSISSIKNMNLFNSILVNFFFSISFSRNMNLFNLILKMYNNQGKWICRNYYSCSNYTTAIRSCEDPPNAKPSYIMGGSPCNLMVINGSLNYCNYNNQ